jgi:hypothetical protein
MHFLSRLHIQYNHKHKCTKRTHTSASTCKYQPPFLRQIAKHKRAKNTITSKQHTHTHALASKQASHCGNVIKSIARRHRKKGGSFTPATMSRGDTSFDDTSAFVRLKRLTKRGTGSAQARGRYKVSISLSPLLNLHNVSTCVCEFLFCVAFVLLSSFLMR